MIQLSFNGAMSTVGSSSVLVDTGIEKIVLDHGTKIQEIPPKFPIPIQGKIDAIIATHCHLDHIGGLPILFTNGKSCPIYATSVTKPLTEMLLLDSIKVSREDGVELPFTKKDVRETIRNFKPVNYRATFKIHKTKATCYDAGHIPGSLTAFLEFGGKTLLYTGDLKTTDTRMLRKADLNMPEVNTLVTESTYSDRDHPDRKTQEKELIRTINDTLAVDGICLIAGFAVGRIDELLLVLNAYGVDCPVYVDGMAKKAITIINQHKNLLKEHNSLDRALENVQYVSGDKMRKKILKHPGVILSTSGMLSGGPMIQYIKKLYNRKNCSLVLTAYQLEGTPGKTLLETGKFVTKDTDLELEMFVKKLDFSAHSGRKELFEFVEKINPERIFCIHGDHTVEFASELREKGFEAVAPLANNRIFSL